MELLEGFDVTGSYRDAAELVGCSPNTVIRYATACEAGKLVVWRAVPRPSAIDAMGFSWAERTIRQAVDYCKR